MLTVTDNTFDLNRWDQGKAKAYTNTLDATQWYCWPMHGYGCRCAQCTPAVRTAPVSDVEVRKAANGFVAVRNGCEYVFPNAAKLGEWIAKELEPNVPKSRKR